MPHRTPSLKIAIACICLLAVAACGPRREKLASVATQEEANHIAVSLDRLGLPGAVIESEGRAQATKYTVSVSPEQLGEARKVVVALRLVREKSEADEVQTPGSLSPAEVVSVYRTRSKQNDIERLLRRIPGVIDAGVVLNMPARDFEADVRATTAPQPRGGASVTVLVNESATSPGADAIRQSVAAATPGLSAEKVVIQIYTLTPPEVHPVTETAAKAGIGGDGLIVSVLCIFFALAASALAVIVVRQRRAMHGATPARVAVQDKAGKAKAA